MKVQVDREQNARKGVNRGRGGKKEKEEKGRRKRRGRLPFLLLRDCYKQKYWEKKNNQKLSLKSRVFSHTALHGVF